MVDYNVIGKRVKQARKEKNMTQSKLADELGVTVGYISQVENGVKCFNLKRFDHVGKVLEKPTGYFIESTEEPESSEYLILEIVNMLKSLDEEKLNTAKEVIKGIVKE